MKHVLGRLFVPLVGMTLLVSYPHAHAETLRDVLSSNAMIKVTEDTMKLQGKRVQRDDPSRIWSDGMDPRSNYALIWASARGAERALNWLGVNIPRFKPKGMDSRRSRVYSYATVSLLNADRVRVRVELMTPHPTYFQMVELNTLREFNRFEPPMLDVLIEEAVSFGKWKARYMRTPRNECSLLFKLSKFTMVNLSIRKCEECHVMMEVAKNLDFNRLDQKLNS